MTLRLLFKQKLLSFIKKGESPKDLTESAKLLVRWIELSFASVNPKGGASSGYHLVSGWGNSYPEITGYLIPTLLKAADRWNSPHLQELALHAGSWLDETKLKSSAICSREWSPENQNPSVFNTGQAVRGWCALWEKTRSPLWLENAKRSADWVLSQQEEDGSWARSAFNGIPHSYYVYVAWPLAWLGKLSGDQRYMDAAKKNLGWTVRQQNELGWFDHAGFLKDDIPTTHTIAYILEGLLESSRIMNDPVYLSACESSASALMKLYRERGYLPGILDNHWNSKAVWRCLAGDAQMGLVWVKLAKVTGKSEFKKAGQDIALELIKTQTVKKEWPEISGAIKGSQPHWGDYDPYRYPTHASKFMLDLIMELEA